MSILMLCDLPIEVIAQIGRDSYRAHQLLRLTCKTYHDKLGKCVYKSVLQSNTFTADKYHDHATFVNQILCILSDEIEEYSSMIYMCGSHGDGPRPLVGWTHSLDACSWDGLGSVTTLTFYIKSSEDIYQLVQLEAGSDYGTQYIWIEDVGFQMVTCGYSVQKVAKFIYDHIPEFYYRHMTTAGVE